MNLTREQAIAEHRKMWNWIADEIDKIKAPCDIHDLKCEYLKNSEFKYVLRGCFLCAYSDMKGGCIACPLMPDVNNPWCLGGLFRNCVYSEDWQEQAALARQIANLPERTDA